MQYIKIGQLGLLYEKYNDLVLKAGFVLPGSSLYTQITKALRETL